MHTLLSAGLALSVSIVAGPAQGPVSEPRHCQTGSHHQFDFWLGQWDVFERGGQTKAADVRVETVLDGCALREEYSDPQGVTGTSLSSYDTKTGHWQQTWINSHGQLLVIQGTLEGRSMVFSGWRHDGTAERLVRARWTPEGRNVRETADTSADGGKTWTPWFDLEFRPRR
jgi:hypothetical protein